MPVQGDAVGSRGEQVYALMLHGVSYHVVGYDSGVKAHFGKAGGGEPGALHIWARLCAEHAEALARAKSGTDDGAYDSLAVALRQYGPSSRYQLQEFVAHKLHARIALVHRLHGTVKYGLLRVLPRLQRRYARLGAPVGDERIAVGGGRPGVCQFVRRPA